MVKTLDSRKVNENSVLHIVHQWKYQWLWCQ